MLASASSGTLGEALAPAAYTAMCLAMKENKHGACKALYIEKLEVNSSFHRPSYANVHLLKCIHNWDYTPAIKVVGTPCKKRPYLSKALKAVPCDHAGSGYCMACKPRLCLPHRASTSAITGEGLIRRKSSGNVYEDFPCVRVGDYDLPSSMDLRQYLDEMQQVGDWEGDPDLPTIPDDEVGHKVAHQACQAAHLTLAHCLNMCWALQTSDLGWKTFMLLWQLGR